MVMEGYLSDDGEDEDPEQNHKFHIRKPVKPYVCSTPGDFTEERNFLLQNVFPRLCELCKLRGGYFSPVDIRWESDDEKVVGGHLLKLLLDYICKCCPYFICLLGETYGPYRPLESPKLPRHLLTIREDADWLEKNYLIAASAGYEWVLQEGHQNTSLTELEIIQAAFLNNCKHCHFYYRQPEHLIHKYGTLPQEERDRQSQIYLPDSEYADLNIRDLKQRIVNKGIPVKFFKTVEELGHHVMTDWKEIIQNVFPILEYPMEILDQEEYRDWAANEMFAECRRQVFITSPAVKSAMDKITQFALTALDEPPYEPEEEMSKLRTQTLTSMLKKKKTLEVKYQSLLAVYGDRGCGKSSLIANWIKKFRTENPEVKVIHQYTGSCSKNTDIAYFLRRCICQLRSYFSQDEESDQITDNSKAWTFQEVCEAFIAVASLGPSVIVIDGMDKIGPTLGKSIRQIKELLWLPFPFPAQCKIICTTSRSDLIFHALSKRSDCILLSMPIFTTLKLQIEFLEEHMQQHFHLLNRNHYQQIHDVKLAKNPLFLSILGNEIESYSVYSHLVEYLDETYDKISSLRDLCVRCFQRWTKEYSWNKESLYGDVEDEDELELEGWIPDTLRLLAVCRGGLTVEEIFTILKTLGYKNTREVKSYDWLQFINCSGNFLHEKANGLLDFSHHHLKDIVEYVLLHSLKAGGAPTTTNEPENEWKEQKKKFHSHVAKFFLQQPFCQRTLDELPWQLLMSGDIKTLVQVLTEPVMLEGFLDDKKKNPSNRQDLAFYWNRLSDDGLSVTTVYQQMLMKLGMLDPVTYMEEDKDIDVMSVEEKTDTPVVPIIITSPNAELSIHDEKSVGSDGDNPLVRSMGSDADNSMVDCRADSPKDDGIDTIFLTEPKQSKGFPPYATKIAWLVGMFLRDMGYTDATESILISLNDKIQKNYPLTKGDLFLQAKTQETLGRFCEQRSDFIGAEKWFVKSLRIIMDNSEEEEETDFELLNLKGCLLSRLGYLRMKEGLYDSAEDLLKEGLEYVKECVNMTAVADIQYNLGLLRMQQLDFVLAESNLRQALLTREEWFGKAHPLVADTWFALAELMSKKDNSKGYDKIRAETLYRKCMKIREACLGDSHLAVADTLLALGKLMMDEISFGAKSEAVGLLRRALDIKTTNLGGDHIDTIAVRNYLKALEVTLKMGKYEFGPAKETDVRTVDRPYSHMSWRENDIKNLESRSKLRSSSRTKSMASRPISREDRSQLSRMSHVSHVTASERLMLETERPARLLNRESVERRLRYGKELVNGVLGSKDDGRIALTDDDVTPEKTHDGFVTPERTHSPEQNGHIIDSFGEDIAKTEENAIQKRTHFLEESHGPVKLYKRYGSANSSRSSKHHRPPRESSARSASSYATSYRTGSSLKSYTSKKDLNPHSINIHTTTTVTSGPNCSLGSLLKAQTPRDVSRNIHHKSAWYHVPGRYITPDRKLPPKRSQKTAEVKAMMRRLEMNTPQKSHTPSYNAMPTQFKKHKHFYEGPVNGNNFGPTVKGIGPPPSEGDYFEEPSSTVTFRGAFILE